MRKLSYLLLLMVGFIVASCNKETGPDLDEMKQGYNFFPLEVGKYVLYDVDSIYWDDFLKAEIHHRSQMRYECVDSFTNGEKETSYVINVMERKTPTSPYYPSDVIHVTRSNNRLIVNQSSMKTIDLVFPVDDGTEWDGLAMLPLENSTYFPARLQDPAYTYLYEDYGHSYNTGNKHYENTVTVHHIDEGINDPEVDSTIYASKNYAKDIYAYDVGLIYREIVYWTFQPKNPDGSGGSGYKKGFGLTMRAVENN